MHWQDWQGIRNIKLQFTSPIFSSHLGLNYTPSLIERDSFMQHLFFQQTFIRSDVRLTKQGQRGPGAAKKKKKKKPHSVNPGIWTSDHTFSHRVRNHLATQGVAVFLLFTCLLAKMRSKASLSSFSVNSFASSLWASISRSLWQLSMTNTTARGRKSTGWSVMGHTKHSKPHQSGGAWTTIINPKLNMVKMLCAWSA